MRRYRPSQNRRQRKNCRSRLPLREAERAPERARTAMIRAVKQYMEEHYAEKLTLAAVAETIPVNASYLSKIFSEVEHMGFADYLCQIRMRHAKELLMNYTLRIYEIAGMVGYRM